MLGGCGGGGGGLLSIPVSLTNRLNQTESAVFQICRFSVLPKDFPFQVIYRADMACLMDSLVLYTDSSNVTQI